LSVSPDQALLSRNRVNNRRSESSVVQKVGFDWLSLSVPLLSPLLIWKTNKQKKSPTIEREAGNPPKILTLIIVCLQLV
jgi:hypothetical protein